MGRGLRERWRGMDWGERENFGWMSNEIDKNT